MVTGPGPGPGAGPGSIVAFGAHPDDGELWAGGTLALHARVAPVLLAVERSADPARNAEAATGADRLGIRLELLDRATPDACAELLRREHPHIVLTHPVSDVHPDHRRVAETVLAALPDAVIATGHPRRFYAWDSYEGLTLAGPTRGHTIVDVTETFAVKLHALAAHQSQPLPHFTAMTERLGRLWGGRIGVTYAEAFDPIPVLGRLPGAAHL